MINVTNLSRRYGNLTAVDQVSFQIGKGEIVGLLGHNGAGKSTIMKMLTGFLEPHSGEILIAGEELADNRSHAQARIGYLPENCPVYTEMSVIDFLDYTASLRGLKDSERPDVIRRAIRQTGLESKALDLIGTLSRGFRQRVGVAQALLHQPEILILDEPTSGLDDEARSLLERILLRTDRTLLVASHDSDFLEKVAPGGYLFRDGRLFPVS